jgi:hypothetical protein
LTTTPAQTIAEQVAAILAPYLGSFNAEIWVKVVAQRDLGLTPQELQADHLATLTEGLRPSLNTFMGRATADELIQRIRREVR